MLSFNMKKVEEYKESLMLMLELYPESSLRILKGEVDTLDKYNLTLYQKQQLFIYLIKNVESLFRKNQNQDIIENSVCVFLELYKNNNFYLNRMSDLKTSEAKHFLFILDNITEYKLIKKEFTENQIKHFFDYWLQVQKSANLVGLYEELDPTNQSGKKRRKKKNYSGSA